MKTTFKYFHEFLKECAKAREQNKPYFVTQDKGLFVLNVYEVGE